MKSIFINLPMLLLLTNLSVNISDDTTATTQPCLHGQVRLETSRTFKVLSLFEYKLKLQFYTPNNKSYVAREDYTVGKIECQICTTDPHNEDSCKDENCHLPLFDCIWMNHGCNTVPLPTSMTTSKETYPTTTSVTANIVTSHVQSADHFDISKSALGTIIGLLSLLVVLLIAGWIWTCWIMKTRGTTSSRTNGTGLNQHFNGYSTSHSRYENNTMDKDTKFESSANYSLLTPEIGTSSGTDGGKVTNGEDEEYCMLDRSCGKTKTTARQQREQLDGYSRLFSN